MDNPAQNRIPLVNETAAAIRTREISYGSASSISLPPSTAPSTYLGFLDQLRFFACEYLHGVLFVAVSLMFVLAFPAVLTKPAKVKAMLGRFLKRSLDILGAIVGLILSSPFFIVLPILIKLDSSGPVFYTQVRVGVNRRKRDRRYHQRGDLKADQRTRDRRRQNLMGRPFSVIKFRTMVADAEKKCGPVWATRNDPRITRIGRLLRQARLDELPQFINVLLGDMSLVGPRPERPNFVADLATKVDNYSGRLAVKPGLTGLAQVKSGYDSDLASVVRKVNLDLEYIDHWSVWSDIKILARTVVVMFTGRGAC